MESEPVRGDGNVRAIGALKALRRRPRRAEACEICSRELEPAHAHLIEIEARRIVCSCDACALLFDGPEARRYRRVPRDVFWLRDFEIDAVEWESLSIPIGLAFFFYSSAAGRMVAVYPSPGGATEADLSVEAWQGIADRRRRLQELQPDVEAALVNRLNGHVDGHLGGRLAGDVNGSTQCYVVPIDRCYELTGLLRKHWRGFTGGDEVWSEVAGFFERLRTQAIIVGAENARAGV